MTRLPDVVGGSIANAVAGHVADGIKCGNFMAMSCTDIPDGSTSWGFNVQFFTGEHAVVIAKRSYSPSMWYAELDSAGWVPGGWIPIATAEPPKWYNASLEAGWAKTVDVKYGKDGSGKGYLVGVVNKASAPLSNEAILRLPDGYRPSFAWPVTFTASSASSAGAWSTYGYLYPDGYLKFTGGALPTGYRLNQGIAFVAEFPTA